VIGASVDAWSKIGGEIDNPRAGCSGVADPGRGGTMWKRRKNDLRLSQRSVFRSDVSDLARSNARALTTLLIGRRKGELQPGVLSDQAAQLPPGVATGAEDTYRNFMHRECITLH